MAGMKDVCENAASRVTMAQRVPESGSADTAWSSRSYALILRGATEELPCVEVKRCVVEGASGDADVRVKAMKPAKGGGA